MFKTLFLRAMLWLKTKVSAICECYGYKLVLQSQYISPAEHAKLLQKSEAYAQQFRVAQNELEQYQHSMLDVNLSWKMLEKSWIDHHIRQMSKESSVGCGSYYELYEKRMQSCVGRFLHRKCQGLSKEGLEYLKQQTGYSIDLLLDTENGEKNGNLLTIDTIVGESLLSS